MSHLMRKNMSSCLLFLTVGVFYINIRVNAVFELDTILYIEIITNYSRLGHIISGTSRDADGIVNIR
jgi:hypothetical protein